MNLLNVMPLDELHKLHKHFVKKAEVEKVNLDSFQEITLLNRALKKRGEYVLKNDYPICYGYYYVINGNVVRWKKQETIAGKVLGTVCRCNLEERGIEVGF